MECVRVNVTFKVVDHELKTFSEAELYCRSEGGMLAMPKTDQHQDFIEILMQQSHSESFWIGLDDLKGFCGTFKSSNWDGFCGTFKLKLRMGNVSRRAVRRQKERFDVF